MYFYYYSKTENTETVQKNTNRETNLKKVQEFQVFITYKNCKTNSNYHFIVASSNSI